MGEIQLLDCTLRDGGYVNDWEFGHNNLISIYERLVNAGVDIVEIGFLDDRRPFDYNRSIMPDTACVEKIWGSVSKKAPMTLGMIDYGTCRIENLQPCSESFLDGIRVIFKKHLMKEAMEYCRQVKALGYKVFSQLVSITSYNDEELMQLIELVNDVKPYAVSMVDTYGLLHPADLLHYYELLDAYVDSDVQIGFHAHNNFQLAYANAITFLDKERNHNIVVDGTLYGMGKSAGNAPDELLAMYLNRNFGKSYDIDIMLEAIEESVMDFYRTSPWNYKLFFYMCALNRCHPNYVSQFMKKENLSVAKLNRLLKTIEPEEKKLLYDKELGEQLYDEYCSAEINDTENYKKLKELFGDREVLVIGPGKNIQLQNRQVEAYIKKYNPVVVSVNYIPDAYAVDAVFVTNRYRYQQMTDALYEVKNRDIKIIATSNVECRNGEFYAMIDRKPLLETGKKITDISYLMLLTALEKTGVKKVSCAGMDGYSDQEDNYFNPKMEYDFVKRESGYLNFHIKARVAQLRKKMEIRFITYSVYDKVDDINGAAI